MAVSQGAGYAGKRYQKIIFLKRELKI